MPNLDAPELLIILIVLAIEIVFVWLVASLAARKGYSAAVWAVLAFFFSWIALIIVLVLPQHREPSAGGGSAGG